MNERSGRGVTTGSSFLRVAEIDAAHAGQHPDAFDRIRGGDLDGLLVHDVYRPDVLASVVARLERHDPPFVQTWFPAPFRSWFYGRNLNLTHPDLREYFRDTALFHQHLEALFPPSLGIASYLAGLLATLDHGKPFRAPPGPGAGDQYMFTTIRAHLEGGFIPPHCDNEHALRPSYAHLLGLIEPHLMSFVLALTRADDGGALEVFDARFEALASTLMNDDRAEIKIDTDGVDSVSFRLEPGTMIILDSGRFLHRVSPVVGSRTRWTVCSFMARSRARDAMYCWG